MDVTPIVEQEYILLPVRTVFEALGDTVHWHNANQTTTANLNASIVRITAGGPVDYNNHQLIWKNGELTKSLYLATSAGFRT